jgi:predicted DNA-binding WGR domain protein
MSITLRRIDPARNMQRFYRLDVLPDLFCDFTLVREWGRMGRGGGRSADRAGTVAARERTAGLFCIELVSRARRGPA